MPETSKRLRQRVFWLCYTFYQKSITEAERMATVTVSQKGWVVIPAEIRRRCGMVPGAKLSIVEYAGRISIMPVLRNPEDEGMGSLKRKGRGGSLAKALERERARERRREDRRK